MRLFSKKELIITIFLTLAYLAFFLLSHWLKDSVSAIYALYLIGFLMIGNFLYSALYFINEFRYDRVVGGRASIEEATVIQHRRSHLTWYWVVLVNGSQLFVFAFLFQYFNEAGGSVHFKNIQGAGYFDWVLYTLDCTFKSLMDIPEIFELHISPISHQGFWGGVIVFIVRLLIYTLLVAALLRQWQKWRLFRETLSAINISPRLSGRRLIRMGEEVLPGLDRAMLKKGLFNPELKEQDNLIFDEHSEPLVQLLFRNLTVGDEVERRNAAVLFGLLALQDHSSKPYFADLIEAARWDPSPEIRSEIVRSLGQIRDKRLIDALRRFLGDPEALVRLQAARALGHLEDRKSFPTLRALLDDPHPEVRVAAVRALGRIGSSFAIPYLKSALAHADEEVRREAVFSLAYLNDLDVAPDLFELAKDDDPKTRLKVVECLQKFRIKEGEEVLASLLQDPDPSLRNKSLEALGEIDLPRACEWILDNPQEGDVSVRRTRLEILGEKKDESHLPFLAQAARDEFPLVREKAIHILGDHASEKAVEILLEILNTTQNDDDKVNVAKALSHTGQEKAYEPLRDSARKSKTVHMRRQAIRSMIWLDPDKAQQDLLPLMEDPYVKKEAIFALIEIRAKRAIPAMIAVMDHTQKADLKELLWKSLKQLSGQDLPEDTGVWKRWYEKQYPQEVAPKVEEAEPVESKEAAIQQEEREKASEAKEVLPEERKDSNPAN